MLNRKELRTEEINKVNGGKNINCAMNGLSSLNAEITDSNELSDSCTLNDKTEASINCGASLNETGDYMLGANIRFII